MVGGLHKPVTGMRHTKLVDRVLKPGEPELVTNKHIRIIAIRHDAPYLGITQEIGKHGTTAENVLVLLSNKFLN